MARPFNAEARTSVIEAAEWLFVVHGYDTTSYKEIAEASGISRSLAQHYFPKKELMAIRFFEDLNEAMRQALENHGILDDDQFMRQSKLAQLSYTYLARVAKVSDFTIDIYGSRHVTSAVVGTVYRDIFTATQDEISIPLDDAIETIRFATGGFFESFFNDLVDEKEIDVAKKLRRAMTTILEIYPIESSERISLFERSVISDDVMQELIDDVSTRFPSSEPARTLEAREVNRYRDSLKLRQGFIG